MLHPSVTVKSKRPSENTTFGNSSRSHGARVFACRLVSLFVALSLFATTTPAAAPTIVNVSARWQADLVFWIRANDLVPKVWNFITQQGANAKRQENQAERDARVSRVQILPGDVTIEEGQQVNFTALAYDAEDNPVSGVMFKWTGRDEDRNRESAMRMPGHFEARVRGNYKLTVEGAGRSESVRVKVVEGKRPKKDEKPIEVRTTSSRDLPPEALAQLEKEKTSAGGVKESRQQLAKSNSSSPAKSAHSRGKKLAHANAAASTPYFLDDGWGGSNYWSADDPGNTRGDPPGTPSDGGAGSGNFQFAAPLLSLPGRGIEVTLALAYNSRLWNKAGSNINYDIDRDWPAPGWSLGFGKLVGMGVYNGGMLIDPDGTRHSYTGTVTVYNWGTYFVGKTTDGTFIDYSYWTGTGGVLLSAEARLSNGTIINYSVQGTGALYPGSIIDPNGNYLIITYVNNTGPRIQTVTDTLGRSITFHYDSLSRLTAITAPGVGSGTRTLVRLHYSQLALSYSFSGLTPIVRDSYPWVIDAIYYPGSGTGYWLNQSDNSYSTYGMIKKVSERRGMTFSGPDPVPPGQGSTEQGTITAGQITREEVYNYPLNTGDTSGTQASFLTDAPTYTSCVETWTRDGTNFDSATTSYQAFPNANPRTITITMPNGIASTQYSHNSPGSYLDGLVYLDELKSGSTVLQSSSTQWDPGAYNSPRPFSVTTTNQNGQSNSTQFSYGSVYNQVTDVRNYDFGGALLRSTRTQYQNSANYTNRHIFSLPTVVEIYAGDNVTRVSRTDYQYDGQALTAAPGVIQHDQGYNPHADAEGFCYWDYDWNDPDCTGSCWDYNCDGYCPQYYICPYNVSTDYRGNVTQVTTYADASGLTGAVSEARRYDVTGNMVTASTSCCQQTSFNFTLSTHYAYPLSLTRGSATDPLNQITTSTVYDFNTGLALSSTDANGRISQTSYDNNTLRPLTASLPGGAHTDFQYDDAARSVTETTYLQAHPTHTTITNQNVKFLNGHGQVRQEKSLGANSVWDIVDTVYDNMGRVSQQTRPYRSGDTLQWNTTSYDALGRVASTQAADGSTISRSTTNPVALALLPVRQVRLSGWSMRGAVNVGPGKTRRDGSSR